MNHTILVATAGQGILRSNDDGDTWHRLGLNEPIEFDGVVRALAVDVTRPARVYAGADSGVCISDDGGAHWRLARGAVSGMTVWSIAIDPKDPRILYAGTGAPSRAALFKSTDAGETWTRLPPELPEFCKGVNRPRLLTICVDPDDGRQVWFGVEEGGVWRSRDGGATFTRLDAPGGDAIRSSDIHAITILPAVAELRKTIIVLTVNTVHISVDDGVTWDGQPSKKLARSRPSPGRTTSCYWLSETVLRGSSHACIARVTAARRGRPPSWTSRRTRRSGRSAVTRRIQSVCTLARSTATCFDPPMVDTPGGRSGASSARSPPLSGRR